MIVNEKRMISYGDAVRFLSDSKVPETGAFSKGINKGLNIALSALGNNEILPHVDAVEVPCKIGDFVWAIKNFNGHKHPQRGIVSDMYFLKDMSLQIVVKYVARGKWGETVFATDKEAYAAIGGRKDNAKERNDLARSN